MLKNLFYSYYYQKYAHKGKVIPYLEYSIIIRYLQIFVMITVTFDNIGIWNIANYLNISNQVSIINNKAFTFGNAFNNFRDNISAFADVNTDFILKSFPMYYYDEMIVKTEFVFSFIISLNKNKSEVVRCIILSSCLIYFLIKSVIIIITAYDNSRDDLYKLLNKMLLVKSGSNISYKIANKKHNKDRFNIYIVLISNFDVIFKYIFFIPLLVNIVESFSIVNFYTYEFDDTFELISSLRINFFNPTIEFNESLSLVNMVISIFSLIFCSIFIVIDNIMSTEASSPIFLKSNYIKTIIELIHVFIITIIKSLRNFDIYSITFNNNQTNVNFTEIDFQKYEFFRINDQNQRISVIYKNNLNQKIITIISLILCFVSYILGHRLRSHSLFIKLRKKLDIVLLFGSTISLIIAFENIRLTTIHFFMIIVCFLLLSYGLDNLVKSKINSIMSMISKYWIIEIEYMNFFINISLGNIDERSLKTILSILNSHINDCNDYNCKCNYYQNKLDKYHKNQLLYLSKHWYDNGFSNIKEIFKNLRDKFNIGNKKDISSIKIDGKVSSKILRLKESSTVNLNKIKLEGIDSSTNIKAFKLNEKKIPTDFNSNKENLIIKYTNYHVTLKEIVEILVITNFVDNFSTDISLQYILFLLKTKKDFLKSNYFMQKINSDNLTFLQGFIYECIKLEFENEFYEDTTNFNSSINSIIKYVIDNDKLNVLINEIYKCYQTLFKIFISKSDFVKVEECSNKINLFTEEINKIFYGSDLMKSSDHTIQIMVEYNLLKLKFNMNEQNKEEINRINQLIDNKIIRKSMNKDEIKHEDSDNNTTSISNLKFDKSNQLNNLLKQNDYKGIENYLNKKMLNYFKSHNNVIPFDEVSFKENNILNKTDFENLSVSIISAEKTNIGIIEYCNDNFLKLFHYSRNDIFNFSINNIIPSVISEHHDNYINRFLRTSVEHIFQKWRIVMGLCKEGYLKPCLIYTKLILGTSSNISFLGVMKELDKTHPFFNYLSNYTIDKKIMLNPNMAIILCHENGNISGVNKSSLLNFGIPFIKNSSININDLIKGISDTDDYFLKNGIFTTINCQNLKNKYEDFYETFPTANILSFTKSNNNDLNSNNPYEILLHKEKTFTQHEIYLKRETLIYNNFQLKVHLYKIFYVDKNNQGGYESNYLLNSHKSFISSSDISKSKKFESPKISKKSQIKDQDQDQSNKISNISNNLIKLGKEKIELLNSRNYSTNIIIKSISFVILLIVFSSSIVFFTNVKNDILKKDLIFDMWGLYCINSLYIISSVNNILSFAKNSEVSKLPYHFDENGKFVANITIKDLNSTLLTQSNELESREIINSIFFKVLNLNQTLYSIDYLNSKILSKMSLSDQIMEIYYSNKNNLYKNESLHSFNLKLTSKINSFNNEFNNNFNQIKELTNNSRSIHNNIIINDLDILSRIGLDNNYMAEKNLLSNYNYILKSSTSDLLWNILKFYKSTLNYENNSDLIVPLVVVFLPIGFSLFGIFFYIKIFDNIYDLEETTICLIYTFYKENINKLLKLSEKILNKKNKNEIDNDEFKETKIEKNDLDVSKHSKANSIMLKKNPSTDEKKSRITFMTDVNTDRNLLSEKNSVFLDNKKLIKSIKKQINKASPTKKNVIAVIKNENNEENVFEDDDYLDNLLVENKEDLEIKIKSYYGIKLQFTVIFLIMICINILLLIFSLILNKQNFQKNELVELIGERSIFIGYILILVKNIINNEENIKSKFVKSDIILENSDSLANSIFNDLTNHNLKEQLDIVLKYSFFIENQIKSISESYKSNFYLNSYFEIMNDKEANTTCKLVKKITDIYYKETLLNNRFNNFFRRNKQVQIIRNLVRNENFDEYNYFMNFNSTANLTFINILYRFNELNTEKNFNFFFYDTISKLDCENEKNSMYLISKVNNKDMYNSIRSILLEISSIIHSSNDKETVFKRLNSKLVQIVELEDIFTGIIQRRHQLEISFINMKYKEVNIVFLVILKILFAFSILFSAILVIFLVYTNKKANIIYKNINMMISSTPIGNQNKMSNDFI